MGRYEVYFGALTDVEYTVTVSDDRGRTTKEYAVGATNPVIVDSEAFATCP